MSNSQAIEDYAKTIQLALEYAPQPPFEAGRPELAPQNVLAAYKGLAARTLDSRRAAAAEAARRLLAA